MSANNAIRQREQSIQEYKRILASETDPNRISDIQGKINLCEEEIGLIRTNKPLFGKPKPLLQETRIYEPDPEKKGEQKITILNSKPEVKKPETIASDKKISNSLRDSIRSKVQESGKSSLRSRIMSAKAAEKKSMSKV